MLSESHSDLKTAQMAADIFRHQYIVLMLIIISFVVGTFTGPHANEPMPLPKVDLPQRLPIPLPIQNVGGVSYPGFFRGRTTELNPDIAEALATVLNQHELSATFRLSGGGGEILATLRSAKLFEYFEAKGVPLSALTVVIGVASVDDTVSVSFEESN